MQLFDSEQRKQIKVAHRVGAVGTEMAVATLIGWFGGHWLDGRFGTTWIAYAGLVLGVVAGFKSLFTFAKKTKLEEL